MKRPVATQSELFLHPSPEQHFEHRMATLPETTNTALSGEMTIKSKLSLQTLLILKQNIALRTFCDYFKLHEMRPLGFIDLWRDNNNETNTNKKRDMKNNIIYHYSNDNWLN